MVQLDHVCSPIPSANLLRLAHTFWAASPTGENSPTCLQPYSEYYAEQCKTFYHGLGANLPFEKHEGIIQLGQQILQGLTREQVVQSLHNNCPETVANARLDKVKIINGAVDLTARLILMVDVGKPVTNRMWTGRAYRSWDKGTIRDFTASIFSVQRSNPHDSVQLDRDFNARNLDVIGGLKVELTNNLLDHLKVIDIEGETTVMIFHHASFLQSQERDLFPDNFVYETLQTLALLFPQNQWYKKSTDWYHKALKPMTNDADTAVLECGPLTMTNIDEYQFWHDRLVRLKVVFDQTKPKNLRQWWNDRREGTQWYALWVAVGFTAFFGLVQSIEGALQVYKSYHPEGEGDG
ncbi:hypothetical protein EDB81DRAFT_771789 [Dactylonectria macrodidyma]|uniref:Uncharacterized protein n=1 Tax=Dactylonectria macrodidyma TaxID=307937 RepID=A0A9P9JIM4_9HYPO|nr:hypothetical protein EDB81DRAFT_771789 [Dactylonectria macrodidyma]